jgi:hypothetical protein
MPDKIDPKKKISGRVVASETASIAVPRERTNFKKLLLSNPNFFGTFPDLGKVVKPISGDTTFEQLTCLGLFPGGLFDGGRLEAVLNINQHSGYGSDACSEGTTEYVRFFVEDSTGWHDLGLSSVQVYDLPGPLPVSYGVYVDFNQARKFCTTENVVNVRAILSWNLEPTAGDPDFTPIWGNVLNARVQVAKRLLLHIPLKDLVAEKLVTFESAALADLDLEQPLPATEPKELTFGELKTLYAGNKVVPLHRLGFKEAQKLRGKSLGKTIGFARSALDLAKLKEKIAPTIAESLVAGIDLGGILDQIDILDGDTSFEQLTCAGYNPQTRTLEGVIQVKQNSGFSGSLCTAGSTEYVSFFAFVGGAWQSLGTAQVQVFDLAAVSPGEPINYAVFRVSNVAEMPCHELTGVPLRAILSWQTEPTGPDFIPTWGNVVNTHIQPEILIGDPGVEQMRLMRIGRVSIAGISNATGLADPTGVAGDCVGNDSPFGGSPTVTGDFIPRIDAFNPVNGDVLPGARPIIYQAWIIPSSGTPFQLTNSFGIQVYPPSGPAGGVFKTQSVNPAPAPVFGGAPGDVYYTYMESDLQAVEPRTLAVFGAGGLAEGNYTIEVRGFKFNGANYVAIPPQSKMIHVYNGFPHNELTAGGTIVFMHRPQVAMSLLPPATDCGDIVVGDTITGTYSVTDLFFSGVSIRLLPITVGGIPQPINPVVLSNATVPGGNSVSYDGTNTNGTSGTFTLSTAGLTPCGYTILLQASDRALVSDSCSGHYNEIGVGFCLRAED